MSLGKGNLIAFAIGFIIPIIFVVLYWIFNIQVADWIGRILCPPELLQIDFVAYPILNGIAYLVFFSIFWSLKSIVRPKRS